MLTLTRYTDRPQMGSYRIFELRSDILIIESVAGTHGTPKRTAIALDDVALPSMRTKGRNIKMVKGCISIFVMIAVLGMGVHSIFAVPPAWICIVALVVALPFLIVLSQALRSAETETFSDASGLPLLELTRPKEDGEDFEAFVSAIKTAIQQRQPANKPAPAGAPGDGMESHAGDVTLPPPLLQASGQICRAPAALSPRDLDLRKKIKSGANWLYWIAGLSGINILLTHLEATWRFAIGLGITELIYAVGMQFGAIGATAGAFFAVVALGCLIGLGYAATKHQGWAFILGIIALSIDTLLLVALTGTEYLMGVVFHVVAIVFLCLGCNALRRFKRNQAAGNPRNA